MAVEFSIATERNGLRIESTGDHHTPPNWVRGVTHRVTRGLEEYYLLRDPRRESNPAEITAEHEALVQRAQDCGFGPK